MASRRRGGGRGPVLAAVALGALLAVSAARDGGTAATRPRRSRLRQPARRATSGPWPARTRASTTGRPCRPGRAWAAAWHYYEQHDCLPHGWPGCHVIGYRLAGGPNAGGIVFVAEHLARLSRLVYGCGRAA